MNWSDENYVKLYTRDTLTWRSWPWQAKCCWPLISRKLDGAGIIEVGNIDPAEAVALQIEIPTEVVRPGLAAIMKSGTLELVPGGLLAPKFVEAQEARKTEAQKKRDQRSRHRDQRRAEQVAEIRKEAVPTPSPDVPQSPPQSPFSSAQLSSAQPLRGSMSSPFEQPRAGDESKPPSAEPPPIDEGEDSRWLVEADAFVEWAKTQADQLKNPGPPVTAWAQAFFLKYQPADPELPRVAFVKFLVWCSLEKLEPGWGLWLRERVWQSRWDDVRAEARKRGAA